MRLPVIVVFLLFVPSLVSVSRGADGGSVRTEPGERFELGDAGPRLEGSASVRIHAARSTVFAILGSCQQALKIVPGLEACEIRERAPDGSSARIWEVIEYARFLPRVRVEVRASYVAPSSVTFERISGDLVSLRGEWTLQNDGDYTLALYRFTLDPGLWVPHWVLRNVLKRDLPKMLRGLREAAENSIAPAP